MPSSLYSLLVFSHSVLGYELNWAKEAEALAEVEAEAPEAREGEVVAGL